jgi:hypothetical protein
MNNLRPRVVGSLRLGTDTLNEYPDSIILLYVVNIESLVLKIVLGRRF